MTSSSRRMMMLVLDLLSKLISSWSIVHNIVSNWYPHDNATLALIWKGCKSDQLWCHHLERDHIVLVNSFLIELRSLKMNFPIVQAPSKESSDRDPFFDKSHQISRQLVVLRSSPCQTICNQRDAVMSMVSKMPRASFVVLMTCFIICSGFSELERSREHMLSYSELFQSLYSFAESVLRVHVVILRVP